MQQPYRASEIILQKEIALMKLPTKGLSYHTDSNPQAFLRPCQHLPNVIEKCGYPQNMHVRMAVATSESLLEVCAAKLLELAFEQSSQNLLRRIKLLVYDDSAELTIFHEQPLSLKVDDFSLKKLFVEFFHLAACQKDPARVEIFLSKYSLMKKAFVWMMKFVLHNLGIQHEQINKIELRTAVTAMCRFFRIPYLEEQHGLFKFSQNHIILHDGQYIYKSSYTYDFTINDSNLISSDSSIGNSLTKPQPADYSIIKKLDQIDEESQHMDYEIYEIRPLVNCRNQRLLTEPNFKNENYTITNRASNMTPNKSHNRTNSQKSSKYTSPLPLNKPNSSQISQKTATSKSPVGRPFNRTYSDARNISKVNTMSFGVPNQQQKVSVGPVKLLAGQSQKKTQAIPGVSFRGLLNRVL